MAQQGVALGGAAAGALLGSFIPGVGWVLGAQVGLAIGSVVGGLLFPQKGPKPQKEDLTVQANTYGVPIPIGSGCDETAGILMWVKGNKIDRREVESGGSGFGGSAGTTFEYFVTFAIEVLDGEVDGFRRIKADKKLIYDRSGEAIDNVIANGGHFVISQRIDGADVRMYLGTDDQMPDPAIQADRGVDNVSAYRGIAYIVFEDFPLADFANHIPNFEVEYVKDGSIVYRSINLSGTVPGGTGADASPTFDPVSPYLWESRSGTVIKFNLAAGDYLLAVNVESQVDSNSDPIKISARPVSDGLGSVYHAHDITNADEVLIYRFDAETLTYTGHVPAVANHYVADWTYRSFQGGGRRWLFGLSQTGRLYVIDAGLFILAAPSLDTPASGSSWTDMVDVSPDDEFWVTITGTSHLHRYSLLPNPAGPLPYVLTLVSDIDLSGTFGASGLDHVFYDAEQNVVLLGKDGLIAKLDPVTETITATLAGAWSDENAFEWQKGPVNGKLWGLAIGAQRFYEIDVVGMTVARDIAATAWSATGTKDTVGYDRFTDSLIATLAGGGGIRQLFLPRIDPLDIDRADVITQYSELANVPSARLDLSLVITTVKGYTNRRNTTARDALEPIQELGLIEPVSVDGKIRWVPLGGSAVVTIPEDDLGASIFGEDDDVEKLVETIPQETSLPEKVTILYRDRENQYDQGSQFGKRARELINTREQMTFDTAEVTDKDVARQWAETRVYRFWGERPVKLSLSRKYLYLIATDPINVVAHGMTFRIKINKIAIGPYLECDGVIEDVETLSSSATGGESDIPQQIIQLLSPTALFLIDSNLIRDEDNNGGHYLGVAPTVADGLWTGAEISKSPDGVSFVASVAYSSALDWGVAQGALGNHFCTATDEYNKLTVKMVRGTLSSVSIADMLNGANAFALQSVDADGNLDWELLQAADVTDLGNDTYELSVMLRGRRGTEQCAAGHASGDKFIVLSTATMHRLSADSEIGLQRYYKATTIGATFNPSGAIPFTNTARGRECYAPENIHAARDGSNNITATFSRRSRIAHETDWLDDVAAPALGEETESYQIDIPDAVPPRTISATSETFSYSATDQTTDGLTPGDPVDGILYQMSATNGRGRPYHFTI